MTFKHKLSCRLALLKDRGLILSTAVLLTAVVLGCEKPIQQITDPGASSVSRLAISPNVVRLQPLQTAKFMAVGLSAGGDTASVSMTWSVTRGSMTDTSTQSGKHYGTYRAGSDTGSARIVVHGPGGGITDTAVVIVAATPVASVTVNPASASVQAGRQVQLAATTADSAGNTLGRAVTWASGNGAVATVSSSGLVTGIVAGSATITATSEGKSGTATVTVTALPVPPPPPPAPVAAVAVSPATPSVQVGGTVQLTATPKDSTGSALSGRTVTWASGNTAVATVSGSGLVSALAAGSATITATSEGKNGTATVTVTNVPVASVSVTPGSPTVAVGQAVQLTATLKDANGSVLTGRTVTWVSNNLVVATLSGSGLVTALLPGSATISATSEGKTGTASVAVTVGGGGGGGVAPWIEEDFSSYTSSLELITAPKAGWMTGGWQYPGYPTPQGGNSHTTDQDIALDQTKGYGGLKQSMRYMFPAFSGRSPQFDYQIRLGGLRLPSVITAGQELWVEWVAMFDPSFNTNSGQSSGTDYKFFFVHSLPDGSGRAELKVGTGTVGEAGNYSLINTGRHFSANVQGIVEDTWTFDALDFGGNNRGVWDGQWHVYRMYMRVSSSAGVPDGVFKVWVDGALYANKLAVPYSATQFDALIPGSNNNQGPTQAASVWWGRIRAWNTNPGW